MQDIYEQIHELEGIPGMSKHEQFVQGIINTINAKLLSRGDALPSVNKLINELGFARETIAKGYKELVERGIVTSQNRKGFFVSTYDTGQQLKVALLLFAFDTFQETFYKTFRENIGENIQLDVFFHHNNIEVFESIVSSIKGRYGMYVVAPIPHPKTAEILKVLPMDKFLMIDRYEPLAAECSYIVQEFGESSYKVFSALTETIRRFDEMIFYYRPATDTPIEILKAFKRFVKDNKIKGVIKTAYQPGTVTKGKVYYTINNTELWAILKDCVEKNLTPGKDVGLLSHNDDIVKEIICNGITTYSTDFKLMAEKAADFVLNREKIQEVIPTTLIRRKSL
ncbi:GntR family transcriptional regulator [Chitinophaga sp. SYP-B3965]|uniref:GntR family transcriptional regulator n=1 Tax=Chitinophaga sp. SYP-B3965 TaxID=2663120 RepID=UPI001299B688|nr:GntR family transcriptional regulator [Chitinophaga sp. SYP-B3965]MRG47154.1 GntR family transcriptional regulator [Chitinophaga sp. SYP-B3965]